MITGLPHPPTHTNIQAQTHIHNVCEILRRDKIKLNSSCLRHQLCFSYKAKTKRKATKQDTHCQFLLTL